MANSNTLKDRGTSSCWSNFFTLITFSVSLGGLAGDESIFTFTIKSKILNEERTVNVQLPLFYGAIEYRRYPVLYQLDDTQYLADAKGIIDPLIDHKHGPQIINDARYTQLQGKNIPAAIELFEFNVANYPNSLNVYNSLADGYESAGQISKATAQIELSLKLAREPEAIEHLKERMRHLEGLISENAN